MSQAMLIVPYFLIGLLLIALGVFATGATLDTTVQVVLVPVLWLIGALLPLAATYDYMRNRQRRPTPSETREAVVDAVREHSNQMNRSLGLRQVWELKK